MVAAFGLVIVPLFAFKLGGGSASLTWAVTLTALFAAPVLAEILLAADRPTAAAAAGLLDAISGDHALFATVLDERLGARRDPLALLYRRRLATALIGLEGRDPLPRRRSPLRLLAALLVLDAALVALPRHQARATDGLLQDLKSYLLESRQDERLDADRRRALEALARAENREQMLRLGDEAWRREERAALEKERALERDLRELEDALVHRDADRARGAAARLENALAEADRDSARSAARRLEELARRPEAQDAGLDLDRLAAAADGSGAGLGQGGPGRKEGAEGRMRRILVALYDGLGSAPPAPSGAGDAGAGHPAEGEPVLGGMPTAAAQASRADRALIERYFRLLPR